jgi:hypothetical protein
MKKQIGSLWFLAALALMLGLVVAGAPLNAQQDQYPSQPQPGQQQSTDPAQTTPPAQAPTQPEQQQAPDPQAQSQQSSGQTFTGTIVKAGDKYVLQNADSGVTYDIDHQEQVKQFEGKRVRVNGTLDADGKTIHVK